MYNFNTFRLFATRYKEKTKSILNKYQIITKSTKYILNQYQIKYQVANGKHFLGSQLNTNNKTKLISCKYLINSKNISKILKPQSIDTKLVCCTLASFSPFSTTSDLLSPLVFPTLSLSFSLALSLSRSLFLITLSSSLSTSIKNFSPKLSTL